MHAWRRKFRPERLTNASSCQSLIPEAGHQIPIHTCGKPPERLSEPALILRKGIEAAWRQPATYPPKCDSLIKIKAERTESAKWITRQCSGKRGIGKVSFIRQIFYVNRDLHFFLCDKKRQHRERRKRELSKNLGYQQNYHLCMSPQSRMLNHAPDRFVSDRSSTNSPCGSRPRPDVFQKYFSF